MYETPHWRKRAELARQAHLAITAEIRNWFDGDVPRIPGPVVVTIRAYAIRPRDPDNIPKLLMDGLVHSGLLPDDDYKTVRRLSLESRKGKFNGKEQCFIVTIEKWSKTDEATSDTLYSDLPD